MLHSNEAAELTASMVYTLLVHPRVVGISSLAKTRKMAYRLSTKRDTTCPRQTISSGGVKLPSLGTQRVSDSSNMQLNLKWPKNLSLWSANETNFARKETCLKTRVTPSSRMRSWVLVCTMAPKYNNTMIQQKSASLPQICPMLKQWCVSM